MLDVFHQDVSPNYIIIIYSLFKIINLPIDVDQPLFLCFYLQPTTLHFFKSLLYIKTYLQTIFNS